MAWGIPLPSAPTNRLRVIQMMSISPRGVMRKGSQGLSLMTWRKVSLAQSLPQASIVAAMPTRMAPMRNTARVRHTRREMSCFPDCRSRLRYMPDK